MLLLRLLLRLLLLLMAAARAGVPRITIVVIVVVLVVTAAVTPGITTVTASSDGAMVTSSRPLPAPTAALLLVALLLIPLFLLFSCISFDSFDSFDGEPRLIRRPEEARSEAAARPPPAGVPTSTARRPEAPPPPTHPRDRVAVGEGSAEARRVAEQRRDADTPHAGAVLVEEDVTQRAVRREREEAHLVMVVSRWRHGGGRRVVMCCDVSSRESR